MPSVSFKRPPEALVRQGPYLVRQIMPAGLHTKALRPAIGSTGAETFAITRMDEIANQRIFPPLGRTGTTLLHHQLAFGNGKAAPAGLQRTIGGDGPGFCRGASTTFNASGGSQTAAVTVDVVLLT